MKVADAWLEHRDATAGLWQAQGGFLRWSHLEVAWWEPDGTPVVLANPSLPLTVQKHLDDLARQARNLVGEVHRRGVWYPPPSLWTLSVVAERLLHRA